MVLEASGTFKRSDKGNSGIIFVPADLVADSLFPLRSNGANSKVRLKIERNRLVINVESPVKLWIYDPKKLSVEKDFENLSQLYDYLRPRFANKMWRSLLPHMFLALAKDGRFGAATFHVHLEASNSLNHYPKALQAAEETGFIKTVGLGSYEVVRDLDAAGKFVRRFDELLQ